MAGEHATEHPASGLASVPPPFVRTIKPRRYQIKPLPVVAVSRESFISESGDVGSFSELIERLPELPPTLFCTVESSGDFIQRLNTVYLLRTPDTWEYKMTPGEKEVTIPGEHIRVTRSHVPVNYFGWKEEKNRHYHHVIDPVNYCGKSIDDLWPGEVTVIQDDDWRHLVKLLKWGVALRDFCNANGMRVNPTMGSTAAQFLKDPRFYPDARRKVPAKINQRARENLPGNHYFLNVTPAPSNNFTAHYLDQKRAHHYHARTTPLPDSDHCYAFGRFLDLEKSTLSTDPAFCGLYCLDLDAPTRRTPFDWIGTGLAERISERLDSQFIYSNELPHLLDNGYRVRSVRAAWGSIKRDTGLPKFAEWSEAQLDLYSDAPWLKPLLLAVYGVLATRPLQRESVFRLAKDKGTSVRVRTGRRELHGFRVQAPRKLEPAIAHVMQRGMIEAATRSESIGLAQWLDWQGHTILSIYADAVMVEVDDDKPLPELPEPWRCKQILNHLQFITHQAFKSDGMTKLPGVSREAMPYRQQTAPGHAPRRVKHDLLTGKKVSTGRRL